MLSKSVIDPLIEDYVEMSISYTFWVLSLRTPSRFFARSFSGSGSCIHQRNHQIFNKHQL